MLDTTNAFKSAIMASQRYTDAIVVVCFAKEVAIPNTSPTQYESPFGTPSANTEHVGFPASQLSNGRIRQNPVVYSGATQQGGIDIPVLLRFPTECKSPSTGWKSATLSNSSGQFVVNPVISVTYNAKTASAIWIIGTPENFPVDFIISINGVSTSVIGNTKHIYTHKFTSVAVSTISVTITKISMPLDHATVIELGIPTRVYFDRNDIIEVCGVEEIYADNGSSIGNVSSNEASVKFNNTSGIFDISSSNSPLSGVIRSGIEFRPFIGVETSDNNIEMVAMGSFTSNDWPVTLGTGEFTLQGLDYMDKLKNTPFPYLSATNYPTYLNISNYISLVAETVGFECSKTIYRTITLLLAYSLSSYIKEWLQEIAESIIGVAYINRFNTLQVREMPFDDNINRNAVKQVWSDSDIIISTVNPQKFGNAYSSLTINVPYISPLGEQEVFYVKDLKFTSSITISNIKFTSPIYYIESIEIRGAQYFSIDLINYNATSGEITLTSTSQNEQTVEIIIKACTISIVKKDIIKTNPLTIGMYELNKNIDAMYIQSLSYANDYATEYFLALGDVSSNFEIETYWNPAIELCDRITINSESEGILVDIAITKQTWTWDGSLSATVEGRKLFHRG